VGFYQFRDNFLRPPCAIHRLGRSLSTLDFTSLCKCGGTPYITDEQDLECLCGPVALTLQRGVMGTARMLHALTHSSISRQVREQM